MKTGHKNGMGESLSAARARVYNEVTAELIRQNTLWGIQNHQNDTWLCILAEEFGEAAKEVNENCNANLREELVQVAAVAIQWIEAIDRRQQKNQGKLPASGI